MWKLMGLFDIKKKSIVKNENISIIYPENLRNKDYFKNTCKGFIICIWRRLYMIQCKNSIITWRGLAYFSNDSDIIIIQWKEFKSTFILITLENKYSLFKPDWYEVFPEKYSSNGLDLHLVHSLIFI